MTHVTCTLCDSPQGFEYTERCDRCWELESRVRSAPILAIKVLLMIHEEMEAK